jgi:methionyl-tRNA formyltransferase
MKKLTYVPAEILRQKAKKVSSFGPELKQLADEMVEVMRASNGIGLAAPQVGESVRLVTIEYIPEEKGDLHIPLTILVNPTITDESKQTDWLEEGCLSIPGVEVPVERAVQVNVLAEDLDGRRIKIRAKDFFARILQHEIDHVNGVLMVERAYPELSQLKGKRVVFLGTPDHAAIYLTALAATEAEIVGVITETDKPAGRNRALTAPPVKQQAQLLELPVYQPETLKSAEAKKLFKSLQADIAIVVAYGKIIPIDILELVPHGFLNVHYSLLPEFRGATPHQSTILSGKSEAGFTIFKLDKGMDTGPILVQKKVPMKPTDTAFSLMQKMVPLSVATLLEVLPGYINGRRKLIPQDEHKATVTKLFQKEDGRIDWQRPVEEIDRQIRALNPWPGAFTEVNGQRLLIHASHLKNKRISIDIVQPAGKKPMTFRDYLRGNQAGLTFFSATDKINLD